MKLSRVQPKRHPNLLHLVNEALQGPQAGLVRLVAVMGAELVVVDDLEPCVGQRGTQGLEVLVGRRRAAVQEKDAGLGIVPEGARPDFELAPRRRDGNAAFGHRSLTDHRG